MITLIFIFFTCFQLTSAKPETSTERCIQRKPTNCVDLLQQGYNTSGIYTIHPWFAKYNMSVYCDMETDGGGWIVFQRRADFEPRQNFYQSWETYVHGFGQLDKEFWLGNYKLYILTNQDYVSLRVDLEDFEGNSRYDVYHEFRIASCQDRFRLKVKRYYGTAGDFLTRSDNATFVTYDDDDVKNCAGLYKGAWWYNTCTPSSLNGLYLKGTVNNTYKYQGVMWPSFKGHYYSLKKSEMKFRPTHFP